MEQRRLAVIDLDGTLVDGNTFHEYLRAGLRNGHVGLLVPMALRFLRLISHHSLKVAALRIIVPDQKLTKAFVKRIKFNPDVLRLIEEFKAEGCEILLATAAPAVYVPWIWTGEYIATTNEELRGERKLQAVRDYARERGLKLYAVVTDHYDDLPLLRAGTRHNILIRPSDKTKKKVAGIGNLRVILPGS